MSTEYHYQSVPKIPNDARYYLQIDRSDSNLDVVKDATLIILQMNPSTARTGHNDPTTRRIQKYLPKHFNHFLLINVFPQVTEHPADLEELINGANDGRFEINKKIVDAVVNRKLVSEKSDDIFDEFNSVFSKYLHATDDRTETVFLIAHSSPNSNSEEINEIFKDQRYGLMDIINESLPRYQKSEPYEVLVLGIKASDGMPNHIDMHATSAQLEKWANPLVARLDPDTLLPDFPRYIPLSD